MSPLSSQISMGIFWENFCSGGAYCRYVRTITDKPHPRSQKKAPRTGAVFLLELLFPLAGGVLAMESTGESTYDNYKYTQSA